MTWPASIIVDTVFIPIYFLLGLLVIFDIFRQVKGQRATFISLTIFAVIRLAANSILVWSYNDHYKNVTALVWGYILQGLGYSFLISASLGLIARGMLDPWATDPGLKEMAVGKTKSQRALKFLNVINIVALVLLIIGYEYSVDAFPGVNGNSNTSGSLNGLVKVGDALYVILTPIVFVFAASALARVYSREQKLILSTVLFALVFMAVRAAYVAYLVFEDRVFNAPLIPKLFLQYIAEICPVILYGILGLFKRR